MPSQLAFSHALFDRELPVPAELIQPNGQGATARFDVYRNNVMSGLVDATVTGFPVVHKLLGDDYFRALAAVFVREHPPQSPILTEYGEALPAFIQSFEPLKAYPYLADVALLELARRSSHNAADQSSVAAEQLGGLDPDQLMEVVPVAHPSLRLLSSNWPVHEIWAVQSGADGKAKPDMECGAQAVQILRPELQVVQYLLEPEQLCFAGAIDGNNKLGAIAEAVLEEFPNSDFVSLMVLMIQRGTIVKFLLPEEAQP